MVGTVVTLKVRSAEPPMKKAFYMEHPDWWELLKTDKNPRVLAIEDVDAKPGRGSLVGPVHACILKAMGFVGVVTNGAIRGRSSFERIGLRAFAGNIAPAHAYSHVVEIGVRVEVAGLRLVPGDLVHGDESGIVVIPFSMAEQVAVTAEGFRERDRRICEYCRTADFSPEALRKHIGVDASRR
jgi:regulator of RNase E activity RraA